MEDSARDIAKLIQGDPDYSLSVDMIEDYIVGYAKRKCEEQRELCSSVKPKVTFGNIAEWAFREEIKNALEPNFDK